MTAFLAYCEPIRYCILDVSEWNRSMILHGWSVARIARNRSQCHVFKEISKTVWQNLEESGQLHLQLGEDAITESMLYATAYLLDRYTAPTVRLVTSRFNRRQEGRNGADWEWYFVGSSGARNLRLRVQAKKATKIAGGKYTYPEIGRLVGSTGERQIDRLIKNSAHEKFYPVYVFYNWFDSVYSARFGKAGEIKEYGCSVYPASSVRFLHDALSATQRDFVDTYFRPSWKLRDTLCIARGTTLSAMQPDTPTDLPDQVRASISQLRGPDDIGDTAPEVSEDLPPYVAAAISMARSRGQDFGASGDLIRAAVDKFEPLTEASGFAAFFMP